MRSGGVDESRRNTHKTRKQRRVDDKPNKEAPATAGAREKSNKQAPATAGACEKLNKQAPATAGACEKLDKQAPATAGACEKIEETSTGNRGSLLFMTNTIITSICLEHVCISRSVHEYNHGSANNNEIAAA